MTQITVIIPFEGEGEWLNKRPSQFSASPPRGMIRGQEIQMVILILPEHQENLSQEIGHELQNIRDHIKWLNKDIGEYNQAIEQLIREKISEMKAAIKRSNAVAESLGIPIKRRDGVPEAYPIPPLRQKLKPSAPSSPAKPSEPEYHLEEKDYETILEAIMSMSLVMERNPTTFSELTEPEIRNFYLMILNVIYEGAATGETFNFQGKTDILIRYANKNIFIAECKIWSGEKGLTETVDQLLKYVSWRDTKTAILVFNRNINLSQVLDKIDPTIKAHPCFEGSFALESKKMP